MRSFKGSMTLLLGLMLFATGCFDQDPAEDTTPAASPALVTVEGFVTAIDDQTPVDGGVTITLRVTQSGNVTLLFPSLFTNPPPDEGTLELYKIVSQVEIEDHVRATGTETDRGIMLDDLTILK